MNLSSNNTIAIKYTMEKEFAERLASRDLPVVATTGVLAFLIAAVSLIGNAMVLLAAYKNPRLRVTANLYVLTLAAAEVLMFWFPIVATCYVTVTGRWGLGGALCHVEGFAIIAYSMEMVLLFTLIAASRYFLMIRRDLYHKWYTKKFTIATIIVSCAVTCLVVASFVVTPGFKFHPALEVCLFNFADANFYHIAILAFAFALAPWILIAVFYYKIWRFVRTHQERMSSSQVNATELRTTRILALVVLVFSVRLSICFAVVFADLITGGPYFPYECYKVAWYVFEAGSMATPFLYTMCHQEFRRELQRMVLCGHGRARWWLRRGIRVGETKQKRTDQFNDTS